MKEMAKFQKGDLLEVKSDQVEFLCSVTELLGPDVVSEFEDCVAVYLVNWEGATNPDVEPKITLWEYVNGDVFASDDTEGGFEYQEVEVERVRKEESNIMEATNVKEIDEAASKLTTTLRQPITDAYNNSLIGPKMRSFIQGKITAIPVQEETPIGRLLFDFGQEIFAAGIIAGASLARTKGTDLKISEEEVESCFPIEEDLNQIVEILKSSENLTIFIYSMAVEALLEEDKDVDKVGKLAEIMLASGMICQLHIASKNKPTIN